jgi:large subunit ribosomal protein L29
MKPADIRALTDEQITATVDELREEMRHMRFEDAVGRMTNTARVGTIKRDIARLLTIQTERQLAARIEEAHAQQART